MDQDVIAEVRKILATALKLNDKELGTQPAIYKTAGWDSLATIEIVENIESTFSIEIPDSKIEQCTNITNIVEMLLDSSHQ